MRNFMKRSDDATFDLNLAPMLDIIVTVIPMLLLSVAFVQVKMLETPVPQMVADAPKEPPKNPSVSFRLKMDREGGFNLVTNDKGQIKEQKLPLKAGHFDFEGLTQMASQVKRAYPDQFRLELLPSETVSFNEIVKVMDALRKAPQELPKFSFRDEKSGQMVETDLMFPDVTFSNVVAE